jgi:GH43 family beta-xylosidase
VHPKVESAMKRLLLRGSVIVIFCVAASIFGIAQQSPVGVRNSADAQSFVNPLLPTGPDPWVTARDGYYYYMNSMGTNLTIWKSRSIADLASAEKKVVWRPPASGPYSHDLWAPELHFLAGKWYIYFAADAGTNQSHRIWVLENPSPDPLAGEWTLKGKVADPTDKWAIDPTVLVKGAKMYLAWSGWEGNVNGVQSIYMAELQNPWTIKGSRSLISTPEYPWEKVGDRDLKRDAERNPALDVEEPVHIDVNEGPEFLQHRDEIFLIYSASACWTDFYELGMLTASASDDLLNPSSWKKSPVAVFWQSPRAHAFGTGHNSFFKSPDGKQDWIIYHANSEPNQGCGGHRSPRAQPFTWNADGTPDFGRPVDIQVPIARPSGEAAGPAGTGKQ